MDQPRRTLSEISHLFLSEVRQRQGGPASRPVRIPPQPRRDVSVDITPEEYAVAFDDAPASVEMRHEGAAQVAVLLTSHLVDQAEHIRQYARHVASEFGRVGLIEADGCELRITCFDRDGAEPGDASIVDELDGRKMSEVLAELAFDVTRWIICLPNPKTAEAGDILRHAPHWVLMTTSDHDGVVAAYRTLKGFAELGRPRLSLVTLDVKDEAQAESVFRKLDGVSRQFLDCRMEPEPPVRAVSNVVEHLVLHCKSTKDKAQLATAPQWPILMEFLAGSVPLDPRVQTPEETAPIEDPATETKPMNISPETAVSEIPVTAIPATDSTDVIDLPAGNSSEDSILEAVVHQGTLSGQWIASPIKPPMCPGSVLAVTRDHRLILLAVAGRGLSELKTIGLAYRWMMENRGLIRMALPQLAIDAHGLPMVKLLVDHGDLSAEVLQPLMQSSTVSVQAYRKLKWGGKVGVMLEAA